MAQDSHLTIKRIANIPSISYGGINTIIHDHLKVKASMCKECVAQAHWWSGDIKWLSAQQMLKTFDWGDRYRCSHIVTGDKNWFQSFNVRNKCQNRVWMPNNLERHSMLKTGFSSRMHMFAIFDEQSTPSCCWYASQRSAYDYQILQTFSVLPHLTYSLYLAPCDVWHFPLLAERMAGMTFTSY